MFPGSVLVLLPIALVLAVLSALFSGVETALFSLQPYQVSRLRERYPLLAQTVGRLLENPRRLLSTILLADVLVNLPLIVLSVFLLREKFPGLVPFWVKALVIFAVIVFVCDLGPKLLALRAPYRIAKFGAPTVNFLMPILDPVTRVLQRLSERIADWLTPSKWQPHRYLNDEELETLVQISAEEGALMAAESEMIQEIIKLGDKNVKDVMTPRIDMFAVPDDLSNKAVIERLKQKRYRRVPVYGDSPDDILGIVDVKVLLMDPATPYTEMMVPPSFVPETMKALDLLTSFLKRPQGMAIVVDEFGGTEGIVTMNDIVEEIISDAVPGADQELYIENLGNGRLLVAGSTRIDDLREYGIRLEAEGIDTVGGLVFNQLGQLPKPGTAVEIQDHLFTVRRTSRKRITELLVSPVVDASSEKEEGVAK